MFSHGLVFVSTLCYGVHKKCVFFSSLCFGVIIKMIISDGSFIGDDIPFSRSSSSHRDVDSESGHSVLHADAPAVVLQDIALKCGTKVS